MTSDSEQPNSHQVNLAEGGNTAPCGDKAAVDLQRFCASDCDMRTQLRKPWAHKGHTYATNGHICVRVPAPDHAQTIFPHSVGDSAAAIFERPPCSDFAPLPAYESGAECWTCSGSGRVKMAECEDCDGDGYFEHGRHEYECKECDGKGSVYGTGDEHDCPECYGTGKKFRFVRFAPGIGYDARYLDWIKALPGAMFAVGGAANSGERHLTGRFIFDGGGEGALMPMRDDMEPA